MSSLRAYRRAHAPLLNVFDLLIALSLMSLAAFEWPAVSFPMGTIDLYSHEAVELTCHAILTIRVFLLADWIGWKSTLQQPRVVIRLAIIAGMVLESLIVLGTGTSHIRVMRLFRPYFLVDNHYSAGVRRVLRQIVQSLPAILDMIVLLLFFVTMMSIVGFYMFATNAEDPGFSTLRDSFVSLFILVTTVRRAWAWAWG